MRDIVLICVVLHNILRSHQGVTDRPPTPADDIQPPQGDIMRKKPIEGGQTSTRPTERLLQSRWGTGWAGGQSLKRLRGENMLSYVSPFQDYPNNPRTFI